MARLTPRDTRLPCWRTRQCQLSNEDAGSWNNLSTELLHFRPYPKEGVAKGDVANNGENKDTITKHARQDACRAFKRAVNLKHDNTRIWSSMLTVAASTNPSADRL